jgi:hypothetical protein
VLVAVVEHLLPKYPGVNTRAPYLYRRALERGVIGYRFPNRLRMGDPKALPQLPATTEEFVDDLVNDRFLYLGEVK